MDDSAKMKTGQSSAEERDVNEKSAARLGGACETQTVAPDEDFRVSLSVENTGAVAGTEVVQLYLKDVYASMKRPVMELAGFARVSLAPGEKKTVEFTLSPSQMAFLDRNMNWKIEKGKLEILVGSASNDICLNGEIEVTDDLYIEGKNRRFYAKAAEASFQG